MMFALWLMNRFAVDPSLAGDLSEEWATGRSSWWLLRQTGVAIMSALWAGLWNHKLRTLTAVAVGWIGWEILLYAFVYAIHAVGRPDFPVGLLLFILRPILLGWIVARIQPTQPLGTTLLFIAATCIVGIVNARHDLHHNYSGVLLFMSWLILTTTVGGLIASRKPKSLPIAG